MKNFRKKLKPYLPQWLMRPYSWARVVRLRLVTFVPAYNEDELMTGYVCPFMEDRHFISCYDAAVKDGLAVSPTIHWRAHVFSWAAKRALDLEGDFVECGVNRGFLSRIAIDYIGFAKQDKKFYLMDTYEGLVDRYITNEERIRGVAGGGYEPCYEQVLRTFSPYKNVQLVKGPIPDTLPEVMSSKIAFLSIDMNCVMPEIAAAEYFWPRMVSGGVIVLDDYGHAGHELQQEAFDKFALEHGVSILCLPTGQGLIFKL